MNNVAVLIMLPLLIIAENLLAEDGVKTYLYGTWRTAPYLSQLGRVITKYTFGKDGECTVSLQFLDAKISEMKEVGVCEFSSDELIMKNHNGTFVHTYALSINGLTITEKNGDVYELEKE